MGWFDFLKSEDQKKAERASQVNQQQQQRLSDVLRQASTKGTPAQKQAAQTYRKNAATQVAQTVSKPKQNPMDKFSDIFDANSAMDRYKRTQTNQAQLYQDQQRDRGVGERSININPLERAVNFGRSAIEGVAEAPIAFGRSTGSYLGMKTDDYKSGLRAEDINRDVITDKNIEMLKLINDPTVDMATKQRAADFLNNSESFTGMDEVRAKIASDTDPRRMAAAGVSLAADLATLGVAGASKAGIKGAYTAAKGAQTGVKGITTGLVAGGKRFGIDTAKTAGLGAIAGGTSAYIQDPNATFKQAVMGAGTGAVGGAALPTAFIAASAVPGAVKATTKLVKSIPDIGKPTGQALTKINSAAQNLTNQRIKLATELDNVRLRIENGDPSFRAYEANLVNQIKKVDDDLYSLDKLKSQRFNQKGAINPDEPSVIKNNQDLADTAKAKKLDALKTEARKYQKWTDFVNDNVGDNKSILNPRRKELKALWENANSEKLAKDTAEREAKRTARLEASKRAAQNQPEKFNGYGMSHRPTNSASGHNLEDLAPDIYSHPEWYTTGDKIADQESLATIMKIKNKPNSKVTVYRASPKGELNDGDWISLSKEYAKGESLAEGVEVHEFTVKASELGWPGDSINEFGYFPKKRTLNQKGSTLAGGPLGVAKDLADTAKAKKAGLNPKIKEAIKRQRIIDKPEDDISALKMLNAVSEDSINEVNTTKNFTEWRKLKETQAVQDGAIKAELNGRFETIDNLAKEKTGLSLEEIYDTIKTSKSTSKPAPVEKTDPFKKAANYASDNKLQKGDAFDIDGQHWFIAEDGSLNKSSYDTAPATGTSTTKRATKKFDNYFNSTHKETPKTSSVQQLSRTELLLRNANMLDDNQTRRAARQVLERDGIDWKSAPVEKTATLQDALEGKSTKLNPRNDVPLARSGQVAKAGAKQSQPLQVKPLETEAPKQLRVKDPELTKKPLSYNNNTTLDKQAYKETFGVTDTQATKDLADIKKGTDMTKVVGNKPTKQQAKLLQSIKQDDAITKAAREAQKTGKEFNFYGKTDKTGRSVGIETFNPKTHRIEGGFVIDQDGVLLGNHIKIDETGTAISMGGRYTKMEDVFGDITKWKSQNKYTSTLERNLMEAAPDEDTGRKAVNWLVGSKTKAERQWKEAISASVSKNDARYKSVIKSKPSNVSNKQVLSDAMDYGEAKLSKSDLSTKYGKDYAKTVTDAIDGMRADYDRYIKDINDTRTRFGLEPIEPRKDYITHISELNNNKNFVGDITTSLKNSITGEAMERSRGGVPADIAGRTEGFAPSTKWNQFLQRRKGGAYEKDPFKAFNEYVPNAEHNIHMTESVVRVRSAEEFLRARANLAELDSKNYGKLLSDELGQKIKGGPQDDKLVSLFQEYANSLAGKTQKLDRAILDSPLRPGLKGWQGLQRIGGRATILGNVSSVLMQPLNQLNVFATVKPKSYAKGMAKWLSGDDVINQSNFVQARVKHIDSALRGKGQKFQDAAGVPLRAVEEQSVKLAWYSNYEDVLRKGLKGKTAVLEADRLTERAVAGRGLADKPEAYRSTAINGFLQYTLEVMAQAKVFWKDLTPVQKAKWIAGAAAINTGYEMVMNDRPLPDYLNAVVEGTGVMNAEDDRNAGEKAIDTAQGLASETVKFNPITANAAQFLPKDLKTTLFGTDSDLTRFDGSAAPLRVISNAYQGAKNIAEGDMLEAAKNILKTVPMGNQAQKTLTGAGMLARGNAIDKNGNPTFDAPTSPADKARALLFGPYATDASQEYYSNQKSTKTKEAEKTAANKGTLTLDQAQANATKRIETAFGREYANLGVKELKELAKTDPTAKQAYDIWNQTTKAFGAGADTPVGLNPVAEKILNRASRTTNENWDNMKSSVGEVQTELQKWLPEGYNLPKVNNYTAKAWADYEKKLADGTLNEISADKARRDIIRAAYKSDLDDITRSFYGLGDDAMRTQLQKGTITKAQMDKVIEIDNVLTALGIQSYAQVGKTLRRELGYAAASGGSKSSGRSGGSKTKSLGMDYKLFGFGDPKNAGGQSLRKLLEKYLV